MLPMLTMLYTRLITGVVAERVSEMVSFQIQA